MSNIELESKFIAITKNGKSVFAWKCLSCKMVCKVRELHNCETDINAIIVDNYE